MNLDIFLKRIRLCLEYEQIAQVSDQVRHEPHYVLANITLLMQQIDRACSFASQNSSCQIDNRLFARESKDIEHIVLADFLATKCNQLIEHRFRIAQATLCAACNRMRSRGLKRDFLLSRNELQMFRDQVCRNAVEIKALRAAQHARR